MEEQVLARVLLAVAEVALVLLAQMLLELAILVELVVSELLHLCLVLL
jgi:hypothetical protein